ncbi:MAG: HutD family protein [Burkholderiaceae bacterium]
MILVQTSRAAPVPWKNGGGVTRELLRLPADGGDDWTLRISVADIAADGPFSPFPGITRWFAVLEGAGVRLAFPERTLNVQRGDAPLCFDGADAPGCMLLDGVTRDLNVMVRHARAASLVTAASFLDEAEPGTSPGFGFFALQPLALHGAGALPVEMPALSLAWCESPFDASHAWSVQPLHAGQEHTLPGYWIRLLPHAR